MLYEDLNKKNNQIQRALDFAEQNQLFEEEPRDANPFENISTQDVGLLILLAHFRDFSDGVEKTNIGKAMDFSYATMENLPVFLGIQFFAELAKGFSLEESITTIAKRMSAFLTFLAASQHGCEIFVVEPEDYEDVDDDTTWGGLYVEVGTKDVKVDFLPIAREFIASDGEGVCILVDGLIDAYQLITGVRLDQLGLKNVMLKTSEE